MVNLVDIGRIFSGETAERPLSERAFEASRLISVHQRGLLNFAEVIPGIVRDEDAKQAATDVVQQVAERFAANPNADYTEGPAEAASEAGMTDFANRQTPAMTDEEHLEFLRERTRSERMVKEQHLAQEIQNKMMELAILQQQGGQGDTDALIQAEADKQPQQSAEAAPSAPVYDIQSGRELTTTGSMFESESRDQMLADARARVDAAASEAA